MSLAPADALACDGSGTDIKLTIPSGSATALQALTDRVQAERETGSTLPSATFALASGNVVKPTDLFSCRRAAAVLNDLVAALEDCNLCTADEQDRYQSRSCNDPKGLTQEDCEISIFFGGLAMRPSDPGGPGYPTDQTHVNRAYVGQNAPYLLKNLEENPSGTLTLPQLIIGWFQWPAIAFNAEDRLQLGYEDCETDADCEIPGDNGGLIGLLKFDDICFGQLADRLLASNGLFPVTDAEKNAATSASSVSEGGQPYGQLCKYATEKLVLTCNPPAAGKATGVKTFCGCSGSSNTYTNEGFFDTCDNTFVGISGQFDGGKSCDLNDNNRLPNRHRGRREQPQSDRGRGHASIRVGRPALDGRVET